MSPSRNRGVVVLSLVTIAGCSGGADGFGDLDTSGAGGAPDATSISPGGGGDGGQMSATDAPYVVDSDKLVEKAGIFTTFRRTTEGVTQMKPRNTHICVLSDVQGDFGANDDIVAFTPTIFVSGSNWALGRGSHNVGAICYAHANFTAPSGSTIMWAEQPGWTEVTTPWGLDCSGSHSQDSWRGDAITFLNSVFGEFEGSGERVTVTQSATFPFGPSRVTARSGLCQSQIIGVFGTYFVGIPTQTAPVFIGVNDARLTAVPPDSEFSISAGDGSTKTVAMARTDRAMCYLTKFSGDFNGSPERLRIFPNPVNGVERWNLQATAGSGSSAYGRARCLAFDQAQIVTPGPD